MHRVTGGAFNKRGTPGLESQDGIHLFKQRGRDLFHQLTH